MTRRRRTFLLKLIVTAVIVGFLLLKVELGRSWELLRSATMLPALLAAYST